MDPNSIIRDIFNWIAIPVLGIGIVWALFAAKLKFVGMAVLVLVVGAAFVYMPPSTLQTIGTSAASGISSFLNR